MSNFKGSIAQVNIQFPIETVIEPIAGENYSRAMIFMHSNLAAANLPGISNPQPGDLIVLDSSSFGEITGDKLKTWLVPFFAKATASNVGIVLYDTDTEVEGETVPATAPLATVYEARKMYAYFKFGFASDVDYATLQLNLSNLCVADPLYSDLWIGSTDANILSGTSTLITSLNTANSKARVVYNPDTTINPALAQLGASLSVANATGTPVGNSCDMVAFNTIQASGAAGDDGKRDNITATQKTACDNSHVGYNTWVGDGTENVVTEGSVNLKGESVGANWVKHYIEFVAKIKTANYITRMNTFRNNAAYQAILLILTNIVQGFIDMGRLANFVLTAPAFSELATSGDEITVPNAWEADYVDNIRAVRVYGTLYLVQPSK